MERAEGRRADVSLISIKKGAIQGFIREEKADTFKVNALAGNVSARDFDALVIPGGLRNTEALRANPAAIKLVREFMELDKPVAAICHAPRLLVQADAIQGRTLTSDEELADEIREAGGSWVNRGVQVDQKLLDREETGGSSGILREPGGAFVECDRGAPAGQDGGAELPGQRSAAWSDLSP